VYRGLLCPYPFNYWSNIMELAVIKQKIGQLRTAEGQVKALISELIVAVVQRVHDHNDVDSANNFLLALTPINQKKCMAFIKEFTGHSTAEGIVTTRRKSYIKDGEKVDPYQEAFDKFESFKASNMNFWQWAVLKKEPKDETVTIEDVQRAAKKANKVMAQAMQQGIVDKTAAIQMLVGNLMTQDDVMLVLQAMIKAEEAVTKASIEAIAA
jgi:hypothetical protein